MATIRKTLDLWSGSGGDGGAGYPLVTTTAGYYIIAHQGDRIELTVENSGRPSGTNIGYVQTQTNDFFFDSVSPGTLTTQAPGPRTYVINSAPASSPYWDEYFFFTGGFASTDSARVEILFIQPAFIDISLSNYSVAMAYEETYTAKLDFLSSSLDSAYGTGERIFLNICASGTHTVSSDFFSNSYTFTSPQDNDTKSIRPRTSAAGKNFDLVLYSEDTSGESLSARELDRFSFSVQAYPDSSIARTSPNASFDVLLTPTEASSGYKLGITGCGAETIYWLDPSNPGSTTTLSQVIGSSYGGETGRTYTTESTREICVHTGGGSTTDPITKLPSIGTGDIYYVWATNIPYAGESPFDLTAVRTNVSYRVARPDYTYTLTPDQTNLAADYDGNVTVSVGGAASGTIFQIVTNLQNPTPVSTVGANLLTIPSSQLPQPGFGKTYFAQVGVSTSAGGAGSSVMYPYSSISFVITREELETTPNQIVFANSSAGPAGPTYPPNEVIESTIETISGMTPNVDVPIEFSRNNASGAYRINGGPWRTADSTVENGDTVQIRITSSSVLGEIRVESITIGAVNGSQGMLALFGVQTESADPNPTGLDFGPNISNAVEDQQYTSEIANITSYNQTLSGTFSGDATMEYRVNGGAWSSSSSFNLSPNSGTIQLRGVGPAIGENAITATVTLTGPSGNPVQDSWSIIPPAAQDTPDSFDLGDDLSDLARNTTAFSGTDTITGINVPVNASISANDGTSGLAILVNGVDSGTSTTVSNGDTVQMKVITSSSANVTRSVTLNVGGTTDTVNFTTAGGGTGGGSNLPSGSSDYGLEIYNTDGTSVLLSPNARFSNYVKVDTSTTAIDSETIPGLSSVTINGEGFGDASRTTIVLISISPSIAFPDSTPQITVTRNGENSATLTNNFNLQTNVSYIGILHG